MANENIVNCNQHSPSTLLRISLLFYDENDDKTFECGQKVQISMLSDLMCNTVTL